MILFIDTSNNKKTTVKLDNLEIVEKYEDPKQQKLLGLIKKALKEKKANLKDISQIKVNTGPGSFTGLRVGCAVANALAWGLGIKVNGKDQVEPRYKFNSSF